MEKLEYNKQKGFSLVTVILAASLSSIIALGISEVILNGTRNTMYMEDKSETIDLKNIISYELSNSDACRNSLENITIAGLDPILLKDKNNNNFLAETQTFGNLVIGDFKLVNETSVAGLNSTGRVSLSIPISSVRGKKPLASLKIPVQVTTASNLPVRIATCYALFGGGGSGNMAGACDNTPPGSTCTHPPCSPSSLPISEGTTITIYTGSDPSCMPMADYVCINKTWAQLNGGPEDPRYHGPCP